MPITIKSTGMKYKNPDTGVYQGVDMLEEATIRDVIVDVYSPTLPYAVGEYCLYNGELYCCTTAIPVGGETWNSAHWDKTNVTDELEGIKGAVDSIGSDDVANESNVSGTTVSDALDTLDGVIGALGSDDVANDSNVSGTTVSAALDTLDSAITHYNAREQVNISELTDSWLLQADNGEYMVAGSSATGSFLAGVDHNYGVLKVVLSPDYVSGTSPYGYIVYISNTANVYYRSYRRDSNAIVWRTDLQRLVTYATATDLEYVQTKETLYTSNTAPSSNKYARVFTMLDGAGTEIVFLQGCSYANGDEGFEILSRRYNGNTAVYNSLRLTIDPSYNQKVYVTNTAPWRLGLGMVYQAGDTFSTNVGACCAGIISSTSKQIVFDVNVPALLERNPTMTVTSLSGILYGVGGCVEKSSTYQYATDTTNYKLTAQRVHNYRVRIIIDKLTGGAFTYAGTSTTVLNDTPISFWGAISIKFT